MKKRKVSAGIIFVRQMILFLVCLLAAITELQAQQPSKQTPTPTATPTLEKRFFKNIIHDQAAIFTAPFHLKASDLKWLATLGISEAALIATDRHTAGALNTNQTRQQISDQVSYLGSS